MCLYMYTSRMIKSDYACTIHPPFSIGRNLTIPPPPPIRNALSIVLGPELKHGWAYFERMRILSGMQFTVTKHFIEVNSWK